MQRNRELREHTPYQICDSFVWEVCEACLEPEPARAGAMPALIRLMGHPNSGLRCWGMQIGWLLRDRLPKGPAVQVLLKNVADTLGGWGLALGLAASCFEVPKDFFEAAGAFQPPPRFEDQFAERLQQAREIGTDACQAPFLCSEAQVRKLIEDQVLG